MSSYSPQVKEVNGRIQGAKRLARGKSDGQTAFIRCINLIHNKYSSEDLKKFIQFEHDAWNTCDASGTHPLHHAVGQRDLFSRGLANTIKENGSEFSISWYTEMVSLFDQAVARICDHLDIADMDDTQIERLVHLLIQPKSQDQPWVGAARKALVRQGLGITRFPVIKGNGFAEKDREVSIPMLISKLALDAETMATIKLWLDEGVAHDPPGVLPGHGLTKVLQSTEHRSSAFINAVSNHITEIVDIMYPTTGCGGGIFEHELASQAGQSPIDGVVEIGIQRTRHSIEGAIGLISGITRTKSTQEEKETQKQNYMRALEGLQGTINTQSVIRIFTPGCKILNSTEILKTIEVLLAAYGPPRHLVPETAEPMAEELAKGILDSRNWNGPPMETLSILDGSRKLFHTKNLPHFDAAITRSLLGSVVYQQSSCITRVLIDFLSQGQKINGCDPLVELMLCNWESNRNRDLGVKQFIADRPPVDTYLLDELLKALVRTGWKPSNRTPETILEMINDGVSCAKPIIDMHLENLKAHGVIEPVELERLFRKCLEKPKDHKDPIGRYAGYYPWDISCCWPAKTKVMKAFFHLVKKNEMDGDTVFITCEKVMEDVFRQPKVPSEQAVDLIALLVEESGWSYEKSVERVAPGAEHWINTSRHNIHDILAPHMSALSHEALASNVQMATSGPTKKPRL